MIQVPLDPDFMPTVLWNREFAQRVAAAADCEDLILGLERSGGTLSIHRTRILPHSEANASTNLRYAERLLKYLLWMKGACHVHIAGPAGLTAELQAMYADARRFDAELLGRKIYGRDFRISPCAAEDLAEERESEQELGGYKDGCRIGFDLGGSDRKCAAVIDSKVVFSEEIAWQPYFQTDPTWHRAGIQETLTRCAEHLPRVDAIGGSAAGVYVDNQVRVASLFRGVGEADFERHVRDMFIELGEAWNVPLTIVNDGEVTALAGAEQIGDSAILGISMGTSMAVGYVTPTGRLTTWLNELAFAPVDYRADAPVDEWSGDRGCGVQYFSQQAVARLAPKAGFEFPDELPFAERLRAVQDAMKKGNDQARLIYESIGTYLGYAIAQYTEFYEFRHVLLLGRVMSGDGGSIIIKQAGHVLQREFPEQNESISFFTPNETMKRHGQAAAAATL